jgi:NTE family protein
MNWIDKLFFRKPKIGLALSGGATLGAAHIGVLQVLEREGVRPDFVAGTSAGALVGAVYCAGVPLDELADIFINMKWPALLKLSITKPIALFDTQPMEAMVRKVIGDSEFSDLEIPFAAVACDLMTGERVVLQSGPVAPAIRASASVPGVFTPVELNGRLLVDGGVVDNLPVEQVKAMGATFTIASDVSNRGQNIKRPDNIFDVLQTTFNIMQDRGALPNRDASDCYIRPKLRSIPAGDSRRARRCWRKGRRRLKRFCRALKDS